MVWVRAITSERDLRQFIAAVRDKNSNIHCRLGKLILTIRDVVLALDIATDLSAVLPRIPFLEEFKVCNCDCSNVDGLAIIASALANKASLKLIHFDSCRIGTRGAEAIATSLGDNTTLEILGICRNSIGSEGAIAFASLFSSNSSIITVNLTNNNIGADGMSALAASICGNFSIKTALLGKNLEEPENHFKQALYNDGTIESVISSNHTLTYTFPDNNDDLRQLIHLNALGPEEAVKAKVIRFLNEQPTFVLTMGCEGYMMPPYMGKIGRDCRLNTMFELIRNVPGLLEGNRRRPEQLSSKRPRS